MLWTDLIDPATLTGYVREELDSLQSGSLAQWLPNREVQDIDVRFVAGQAGLVEAAKFRAYDAEPEIGKGEGGKRVVIELPAIGQNIPVTEYNQLRARSGSVSDSVALDSVQKTGRAVAQSVFSGIERMRGIVLATGRATINQDNFKTDDDFGRAAGHTVTETNKWSTASVDRIAQIQAWVDTYVATNGVEPGSLVMGREVYRAFAAGDQFRTQLLNGASRPANQSDVNAVVEAAGLPPITVYSRQIRYGGANTRVLPANTVLMLPAPVGTGDYDATDLGASFWGRTLTSTDPEYGLADVDQPGVVVGVYRNPKPPMIAEVVSDAIALPVLANANLSFAAVVL